MYKKKGLFDYVFCIGDFFGDDDSSEQEWEEFKKSGIIGKNNVGSNLFKIKFILIFFF